jgi:hypothetical protein
VWLPDRAQNVTLHCDLDTNQAWLSFELDATDRAPLMSHLDALDQRATHGVRAPSFGGVTWWFDGLIQQQPDKSDALNSDLYRGRDEVMTRDRVVAFERGTRRVFSWIDIDRRRPPAN